MTGSAVIWAAAFAVGAVLGALYLGLLWASVRALNGARPVAAFAALAAARAALVLGALAIALMVGARAGELLVALLGFLVIRVAATRLARGPERGQAWK